MDKGLFFMATLAKQVYRNRVTCFKAGDTGRLKERGFFNLVLAGCT